MNKNYTKRDEPSSKILGSDESDEKTTNGNLLERLQKVSNLKEERKKTAVEYEGQEDDGEPDLYDSANGDILLRSSMWLERGSVRKYYNMYRGFTKVDHKYIPRIRKEYRDNKTQPRNTRIRQMVSGDELLTLRHDYELDEIHYLERDQIENVTGVDLPDSDLTKALKTYIERRIEHLTKSKLPAKLNDELLTKFIDSTAVLALAKYTEELVKEKVNKKVVAQNAERVPTNEEELKEESTYFPFKLTEEYHGNEFQGGPFEVDGKANPITTKSLLAACDYNRKHANDHDSD